MFLLFRKISWRSNVFLDLHTTQYLIKWFRSLGRVPRNDKTIRVDAARFGSDSDNSRGPLGSALALRKETEDVVQAPRGLDYVYTPLNVTLVDL